MYIKIPKDRYWSPFRDYKSQLDDIGYDLYWIRCDLDSERKGLDKDIKNRYNIDSRLYTIVQELKSTNDCLDGMKTFLIKDAKKAYDDLESKLKKEAKLIKKTKIERMKDAEKIKFALGALTLVASVVCPASWGIAVTIATSLVTTTVDHLCASYIDDGTAGIDDWGAFGRDAVIGTAVDIGLSGMGDIIGKSTGAYIDDASKAIFKGSKNTVIRAGTKCTSVVVSGATKGLVEGVAKDTANIYVDEIYDSIVSGDFSDTVEDINDRMSDEVWNKDTILKHVADGVAEEGADWLGDTVKSKMESSNIQSKLYYGTVKERIAINGGIGAASKMIEGAADRGVSEVFDGMIDGDLNAGDVMDKILDPDALIKDAVKGTSSGVREGAKDPSFILGMSEKDAARYKEADRYNRRLSGNYNEYNTDLVVSDPDYMKADGTVNWEKYAPNGGAVPGTVKTDQTLPAGTVVIRYGNGEGCFVAPAGTEFSELSLPYIENPSAIHKYVLTEPISGVTSSEVAPGFGQKGGGTQYQLPNSVWDTLFSGKMVEIE